MKTITRKDYLDGEATHSEYYGQFVDETVLRYLSMWISDEKLNSAAGNLSQIPLETWSTIPHPSYMPQRFKDAGDIFTQSGKVCLYKEAARQKLGIIKGVANGSK